MHIAAFHSSWPSLPTHGARPCPHPDCAPGGDRLTQAATTTCDGDRAALASRGAPALQASGVARRAAAGRAAAVPVLAVPVAVQIVGQPPAGMPHGFATACHAAVPVDRFSTPEHANEQSPGYTFGLCPY